MSVFYVKTAKICRRLRRRLQKFVGGPLSPGGCRLRPQTPDCTSPFAKS